MSQPIKVPKFKDLPIIKNAPKGSAWGVFDNGTMTDRVGTLNFVTPAVVVEATKEIKTGESCVLK
jgi:hypothetical protein